MYLNEVAVAGAASFLSTLSTDTASQLDVLGHDGHTLGVDGAQVGVFKETDQVSLASLLQGHNSGALETEIGLEVLGDLTDQTLEGQFADQQLSALLVTTDLTESHGTGPVTMGLLDTSGGRSALTRRLGCQLLARSLSSGRFAGGLLGTSHDDTQTCSNFYNLSTKMRLSHPFILLALSLRLAAPFPLVTNENLRHKTRTFKVNIKLKTTSLRLERFSCYFH